jgi:nicotinate-nucleotide pyrophosphorylase (carboxylating)
MIWRSIRRFSIFFLHPQQHFPQAHDMESLTADEIRRAVQEALAEDIGSGDVTTLATIPLRAEAKASMVTREPITVAGIAFAEAAFQTLSPAVSCHRRGEDAWPVAAGAVLLGVDGPARALLTAERVALNFVQRLSGIATLTARFVEAVRGTGAWILDTRKTTPGWRRFEKYAVACGGGHNHRAGLFDLVLIKDNHLETLRHEKPNAIAAAVQRARDHYPDLKVEVETDSLAQVEQAVAAGADIILFDNMSPAQLHSAVRLVNGRAKTEASGGVNLGNVRAIAETGVDFISIGALTHGARAVDIALDFEPGEEEPRHA